MAYYFLIFIQQKLSSLKSVILCSANLIKRNHHGVCSMEVFEASYCKIQKQNFWREKILENSANCKRSTKKFLIQNIISYGHECAVYSSSICETE